MSDSPNSSCSSPSVPGTPPPSTRSPLRLADTSALALRLSSRQRRESSEERSTQSQESTGDASKSLSESRDASEELGGSGNAPEALPAGTEELGGGGSAPFATGLPIGTEELAFGGGRAAAVAAASQESETADEDYWLLEIVDMQTRMRGWFDSIRGAALPPTEAARVAALREGWASQEAPVPEGRVGL